MKLTCVTAVFNAIKSGNRERLIKCVKSLAQLKTEHEHLIYDGASTDGTVELLRELEVSTPTLKVVSESDTGIYNALNKGIRDAQGEWFYVLGCDDYVNNPELMDRLVVQLDDTCDILATTVRIEKEDGTLLKMFEPRMSEIYNNPCACHQGELMRTSVARELGGFDEQYQIAADSDMFLKAHLACYKFKYVFDQFATFVSGGISAKKTKVAQKEHRMSVANLLNLSDGEKQLLFKEHVLSLKKCFKLWKHDDLVIRTAAKAMCLKRIKGFVRCFFYPVVILTRPLRRVMGVS